MLQVLERIYIKTYNHIRINPFLPRSGLTSCSIETPSDTIVARRGGRSINIGSPVVC